MFRDYPYLNLQDLNLDYILRKIKEMQKELNNFVVTNAIKYADPIDWNITKQYEKNTVVIDANTGIAYLSVAPAPSGVSISNTDFWTVIFDISMFVDKAAKNLTDHVEEDETNTATFNSSIGDWLIWYDVLYRATAPINTGDAYVIGSNIEHITIEDIANEIIAEIYTITTSIIGDLNDLHTTDKTTIVNALNEVIDGIDTRIDNLKIVNVKDYGAMGDGVTDDTIAIQNALDYSRDNGGAIVYFPTGTYIISNTLTLYSFTTLKGVSSSKSIIKLKANSNCDMIKGYLYDTYADGTALPNTITNIAEIGEYITAGCNFYNITLDGTYYENGVVANSSGCGLKYCAYRCKHHDFRIENVADVGLLVGPVTLSNWSIDGTYTLIQSDDVGDISICTTGAEGAIIRGYRDCFMDSLHIEGCGRKNLASAYGYDRVYHLVCDCDLNDNFVGNVSFDRLTIAGNNTGSDAGLLIKGTSYTTINALKIGYVGYAIKINSSVGVPSIRYMLLNHIMSDLGEIRGNFEDIKIDCCVIQAPTGGDLSAVTPLVLGNMINITVKSATANMGKLLKIDGYGCNVTLEAFNTRDYLITTTANCSNSNIFIYTAGSTYVFDNTAIGQNNNIKITGHIASLNNLIAVRDYNLNYNYTQNWNIHVRVSGAYYKYPASLRATLPVTLNTDQEEIITSRCIFNDANNAYGALRVIPDNAASFDYIYVKDASNDQIKIAYKCSNLNGATNGRCFIFSGESNTY